MIIRLLFWRTFGRRQRRRVVWGVAAVAGMGAVASNAEPTGTAGVDVLLNLLAGLGVAWCVANSSRWTWPVVAAGGAFLAEGPWLIAGVAGLVLSFAAILEVKRDRVVGALVGAVAVQVLFRMSTDDVSFFVPTAIALGAAAPAVCSAVSKLQRSHRRRVVVTAAVVTGLTAFSTFLALTALVAARNEVNDAIVLAQEALGQIRTDDRDSAAESFRLAEASFQAAQNDVRTPWAAAGRAVPVVAQQLRAADDLTGVARALALTSADAIEELDLDSLSFAGGRVDLERVAALEAPATRVVDETAAALERLRSARNDWLLPQLTSRVDTLDAELDAALPALRSTVDAVRAAPWLLGADAERRYLVLFTTPSESRELGGFVGAYGILSANDGDLSFEGKGSSGDLSRTLQALPDAHLPDIRLTTAFGIQQPQVFPQAWSGTADFPTAAAVAKHVYEQADPRGVDGILLADPYALRAMLEFTGPATIPEIATAITPANAIDFLLRDQYLAFSFEDQGERKDLLVDVGEAVFAQLVDGAIPAAPAAAATLGPVVADRHLFFVVDDPQANAVLTQVGLAGPIAPPASGHDVVHAVSTNLRANKLDAYIDRTITIDLLAAESSDVTGTITGTIENNVPRSGLNTYVTGDGFDNQDRFPEGDHFMFFAIYTTLEISGVTIDGEEAVLGREEAYGMQRYAALVRVPQGRTVDVAFAVDDRRDPRAFEVDVIPYAGANPDTIVLDITRR